MNNITRVSRPDLSRRSFLGNVFSAGALVLGAKILPVGASAADLNADAAAWHPNVYLGIEPDGSVIVVAHRSEMGTGIRTALPTVVADELEADWGRVKIQQAIGDKKYGDQNTDGSNSIRSFYEPMRRAGASARMMLEQAAAQTWNVPVSEVKAQNHFVVHTSGKKLGFGELVSAAGKEKVPATADLKYKSPSEYRYVGKDLPITDLDDLVTGKGIFGQDARMPGMVYASIERAPVFGGTLKSLDDAEAKQVKGVSGTTKIDGFKPPYGFQALGGVAVIADSTWAAMQGRKKLKIDWDLGANASYDSAAYRKQLEASAAKPSPRPPARAEGDVDAAFAKATKTHEAAYYTPTAAHAPMEPPAAVAEFKDGKVVCYTCTQNPQAVQSTVAAAVGIKPEDVTCHVTLLGGGFGRKSKPDYVAEAAVLSKQLAKPVKVVWTREDDIHFDFFHGAAAMYMKAALDNKGMPIAWLGRTAFPPIGSQGNQAEEYGGFQLGMGFSDIPYDIPNIKIENGPAMIHQRIGWMRSVANIHHAYAVHSFIDELAAMANMDRVQYILALLGKDRTLDLRPAAQRTRPDPYMIDTARYRRVLETVAEQSGWANKKSGNGKGYGIALHRSFLSYIGAVVEVEVGKDGKVNVTKVDYVVDAGKVVHPDRVRAQFEGAAVFAIGLAKTGEITSANGQIVQSNFHNYQVARITDAPRETKVTIIGTDNPPAGVGEPGVPPIAPAICNAIFAATGKRVRELPLKYAKLA
jgi:isoquinoline 1-oxidoreductase beta subunit